MGINPKHLRDEIIIPTLNYLDLYSESATNLLLLTAAVESNCGEYLVQLNGPALGIYQMEPATHNDIWGSYLEYRSQLPSDINTLRYNVWGEREQDVALIKTELVGNLYYATAMARVHYLRVPEALPEAYDVQGLATYWKKHYNTPLGKGTVEKAEEAYIKLVLSKV